MSAANTFKIRIAAVDGVTATMKAINGQIRAITAPVRALQKSFGDLARETGLTSLTKRFEDLAKAAGETGNRVARFVEPLAAIAGIVSVAGLAKLTNDWANFGTEIGRTSSLIGVSAADLQKLRGAASLAGISSEDLTGAVQGLSQAMEDARFGRNDVLAAKFAGLGISLVDAKTKTLNVEGAFMALADRISRLKGPEQQAAASFFGIASALPLLKKGSAGIAGFAGEAMRLKGILSGGEIGAADQLRQTIAGLRLSAEGLWQSIGGAVAPVLMPLIAHLRDWLAANRDLITADLTAMVRDLAQTIEQISWSDVIAGVRDFGTGIRDTVGFLGGWRNAAILVIALANLPLIASFARLTWVAIAFGGAAAGMALRGVLLLGAGMVQSLGGGFGWMLRMAAFIPGVGPLLATLTSCFGLFGSFVGVIIGGIGTAFTWLGGALLACLPVAAFIGSVLAIAGAVYMIIEYWTPITQFFWKIGADIGQIFGGLWDIIVGIFTGNFDQILDGAKSMVVGLAKLVSDGASGIVNSVKAIFHEMRAWLPTWLGGDGGKGKAEFKASLSQTMTTIAKKEEAKGDPSAPPVQPPDTKGGLRSLGRPTDLVPEVPKPAESVALPPAVTVLSDQSRPAAIDQGDQKKSATPPLNLVPTIPSNPVKPIAMPQNVTEFATRSVPNMGLMGEKASEIRVPDLKLMAPKIEAPTVEIKSPSAMGAPLGRGFNARGDALSIFGASTSRVEGSDRTAEQRSKAEAPSMIQIELTVNQRGDLLEPPRITSTGNILPSLKIGQAMSLFGP